MSALAVLVAILLAGTGAVGYGVAAWLQQGAVGATAQGTSLGAQGWRRLLRNRRWVGGTALLGAGALMHASSLALAPLVIVQPVGVVAIVVAALLATRSAGVRMTRPMILAVAAGVTGVGCFVALAASRSVSTVPASGAELRACFTALAVISVFAAATRICVGRARCLAFSGAAGITYGLVSVLIHISATRFSAGGIGQVSLVTVPALLVALPAGAWFVQHAYAAGPPQVVVASQAVLDPFFGIAIGAAFLGEGVGLSMPVIAAMAGSGLAAIAGVIGLALCQRAPTAPVPRATATGANLRIVVGADTFPPDINGAANFAYRLARALAAGDHEVHVLCPATAAGPAWLQALVRRLAWFDLRRVFGRAQAVTAPTPTAVRMLAERGLPGATTVSCGIDLDRYRGPALPGDGKTVLFVGRLDVEKHVDELLRAAAACDATVEIVGDGTQRAALGALARDLGISRRVTFHGFVDEDSLVAAYRRCAVFCMPGTAELQSLATMEAMAAGKPVTAADALALAHLVQPGHTGWLYPPGTSRPSPTGSVCCWPTRRCGPGWEQPAAPSSAVMRCRPPSTRSPGSIKTFPAVRAESSCQPPTAPDRAGVARTRSPVLVARLPADRPPVQEGQRRSHAPGGARLRADRSVGLLAHRGSSAAPSPP